MAETTNRRKRRSVEERVAEVEQKIAYHEEHLKVLNQKKQDLLNPTKKTRKASMKQVTEKIKESGLSPDELLALINKATK